MKDVERYATLSHGLALMKTTAKAVNGIASINLTREYGDELKSQKVGDFWVDQSVRTIKRIDTKYVEQLFEEAATTGNWSKENRDAVWDKLFTTDDGEKTKSLRLDKKYVSDELTMANKKLGALIKSGIEASVESGALNSVLLSASILITREAIFRELTTPQQELFDNVSENLSVLKTNDLEQLCGFYNAMRTFNNGLEAEVGKLRGQLLQSKNIEGYKIVENAPRRKFNLEGFREMVQDPEAEPPIKESSFKVCYIMDERLYNIRQQYSRKRTEQAVHGQSEQDGQTETELNELFL